MPLGCNKRLEQTEHTATSSSLPSTPNFAFYLGIASDMVKLMGLILLLLVLQHDPSKKEELLDEGDEPPVKRGPAAKKGKKQAAAVPPVAM